MSDDSTLVEPKLKIKGGPSVSVVEPVSAKSVTLTFSTEQERKVYDAFAQAAANDDRSISSFVVRYLLGKEDAPTVS